MLPAHAIDSIAALICSFFRKHLINSKLVSKHDTSLKGMRGQKL
jgi:hypothetical protein